MKAFIAGGSGFVGKNLTQALVVKGYEVTIVGSSPTSRLENPPQITYLSADTAKAGDWQNAVQAADVVINLTGRSIFHLWTKKYKQLIYDSRILTTRNLVEAMSSDKTVKFLSTSAVGYYGERGDNVLTETEPNGGDFLAKVCKDWETEAFKAEEKGVNSVVMRFGVVLGDNGGALGMMMMPYRFFVGGPMGGGGQWFSWIHIEDLVSAFMFAIDNESAKGVFNLCAPYPIRNAEMAKNLGSALKRPSFIPMPGFVLKTILGEYGATLLQSQRAAPENLQKLGFEFKYPTFSQAIDSILT